MIHRLQRWLQKSAEGGSADHTGSSTSMHFAAADTRAYENVLPEIVGAWESLLLKVPSLYGWEESSQLSEVERWSAYGKSWRFLWTHLEKTATSLAIAVWNEDRIGSRYFRDALLRWPEAYEFRFAEEAQLRDRRLLFPDVLNRKWQEARAQAVSLSFDYVLQPSPEQIFASILRCAHEDVLLLTMALLLSWTVNEKNSTDIGARTASGILRRESSQDQPFSGREREFGFRSLFLHFLRLRVAGERFEQDSYAANLDALVETLDSMTERPVVPGRVYAPSTLHDRQGLRLSTVAVLAATAPPEGDDGLIERVRTLAMDEHLLPYGDRSLRSIVDELSAWRSTIENQTHTQVTRGASLLFSDQDYDSSIAKLHIIVASAEEMIESERVARMTIRPIDAAKLERL